VHLVTGSYFQSCKKDCCHASQSAVAENPVLHTHFTALCVINAELLEMEFSHCGDLDFCWRAGFRCENTGWLSNFFAPVILTTIIYELDPYSLEIYGMCRYELHTSRLSKVVVWQTYTQPCI